MRCPQCFTGLSLRKGSPSYIGCAKCGGRFHTFQVFEKKVGTATFEKLVSIARAATAIGKVCPQCEKKMNPLHTKENPSPLDFCFQCKSIWFDFLEFENFKTERNVLGDAFVKMRKQNKPLEIAGVKIEAFDSSSYSDMVGPIGSEAPIAEQPRIRGFPSVTYFSALACLVVFLKTRTQTLEAWEQHAFKVGAVGAEFWQRLVSSFFMHANDFHLGLNLYLLLLIAGPAEDVSSPFEFLTVLFGGHIVGTMLEALFLPRGTPIAGANAGVFSVLIYYAVLFPKSRFQVTHFMGSRYHETGFLRISFPIQVYVFLMVVLEACIVITQRSMQMGHLAHLAGGAVGLFVGLSRKPKI